jgi:hypothetical protein
MLIKPPLQAIPFAPVPDMGLGELQKAVERGARVVRATYRLAGSPRPGDPKIDFVLADGDGRLTRPVTYGPRTLEFLQKQNINVENL